MKVTPIRAASYLACVAFGCRVFSTFVRRVWVFTVDDAFITLRYAKNLASGFGPVWNPNAPPVEGYTTWLWMVLLALPHVLGVDALAFAKGASVVCTVACVLSAAYYAYRLTGDLGRSRRGMAPALTVATVFAFPATAVHAVSGMETALFSLLLIAFLCVCDVARGGCSPRVAGLLSGLALATGLTRPEGNLLVSAALIALFVKVDKPGRASLARAVFPVYVGGGAAYFAFRTAYYHELLPLPFYVKAASNASTFAGADEVYSFLKEFVFRPYVFLPVVFAGSRLRSRLVPAGLMVLSLLGFFTIPAPIMAFDWRYLFPTVPILLSLAAVGFTFAVDELCSRVRVARLGIILDPLLLLLFGAVSVAGLVAGFEITLGGKVDYGLGLKAAHERLARTLASVSEGDKPHRVALVDVGAIAYLSGWETLDSFGLNDVRIARSGSHDPSYVLDFAPDVLVLISSSATAFVPALAWEGPLEAEALARDLRVARRYEFMPGSYYLWAFARPGTPASDALLADDRGPLGATRR